MWQNLNIKNNIFSSENWRRFPRENNRGKKTFTRPRSGGMELLATYIYRSAILTLISITYPIGETTDDIVMAFLLILLLFIV